MGVGMGLECFFATSQAPLEEIGQLPGLRTQLFRTLPGMRPPRAPPRKRARSRFGAL